MKTSKKHDLITIGRSSIDLYSQNIGAPFNKIKSFDAFVGGSPLNIAVGCARLGMDVSLLTAVGQDKVGEFIVDFLQGEQVGTQSIPIKKQARSSAVILGIEPPDKFPLVYYRDNAADSQLDIDNVTNANIEDYKMIQINGTALNMEPTRSATFLAAEIAVKVGTDVLLDLDFRADQWHDIRAFGITIRAILHKTKIVLGTEEEILATALGNGSELTIEDQQISAPTIKGDINECIQEIMSYGIELLVVKRGEHGARAYTQDGKITDIPGFPVKVLNVLGAGDAFASGFIYGLLQGWDLYKCCRMGNASGAQVVTRNGCANFMPTLNESMEFIESHGGF